ncbi:MAG: D-glycero-beta-D-manno-heptose-7-phosphate kinase [Candidatus Binatia bacterium]|nr:D-glycero-beta-D-manno-heptose-7-phosphate kinase [Candidatus Binatia bacterium]
MSPDLRPEQVQRLLRKLPQARVLVVGDLMLDEFLWGTVERISPEAPVPVVRIERESTHLGGAANVAHNLRSLGARVTVCGVVGSDRAGDRILAELKSIGADTSGVIRTRGLVTTRKTRVIAHHQQVVRFDREQVEHPPAATKRVIEFLRRHNRRYDAVLISDYAKGTVTAELLSCLSELHRATGWPLVIDPKKPNFGRYSGATLMTPNQHEAAEASGIEIRDDASLRCAGERLLEAWSCEAVLITRGEAGMSLFRAQAPPQHFPTQARDVYDVTGAGDTVAAVCTLSLAAGFPLEVAVSLANVAAGIAVGKLGTATVTPGEILNAVARNGAGPGRGKQRRSRA